MEPNKANNLTIYPISESAVTIEFGNTIGEALMNRVSSFNRLLHQKPFRGLFDIVPAYASLTVFFDPMELIHENDLPGKSCYEKVSGYLQRLKGEKNITSSPDAQVISIPVCYGGSFGPDLDYVAKFHQLTANEVIKLHSSAIYKVYMIGFVPGFAYMGGLSELLETPRKDTPRQAVPAGAVGIAGKQAGIYPLETPSGWQIIGQTTVKLFDANRQPPALLKAGDRVKFETIDSSDFINYVEENKVPPSGV